MLSFLSHFMHFAFRLIVNLEPASSLIRDSPTLSHLWPFVLLIFSWSGKFAHQNPWNLQFFPKKRRWQKEKWIIEDQLPDQTHSLTHHRSRWQRLRSRIQFGAALPFAVWEAFRLPFLIRPISWRRKTIPSLDRKVHVLRAVIWHRMPGLSRSAKKKAEAFASTFSFPLYFSFFPKTGM